MLQVQVHVHKKNVISSLGHVPHTIADKVQLTGFAI